MFFHFKKTQNVLCIFDAEHLYVTEFNFVCSGQMFSQLKIPCKIFCKESKSQ